MSIDPIYTVWCDIGAADPRDNCQKWCQHTEATRALAWESAKRAGWKRLAGLHVCPACQQPARLWASTGQGEHTALAQQDGATMSALDVECPVCKEPPGRQCRSLMYGAPAPVPISSPHDQRRTAVEPNEPATEVAQ